MNKQDLIKRLRENTLYKSALASVDDKEAEKIARYVEALVGNIAEKMTEAAKSIKEKPSTVVSNEPSGSSDGN